MNLNIEFFISKLYQTGFKIHISIKMFRILYEILTNEYLKGYHLNFSNGIQ